MRKAWWIAAFLWGQAMAQSVGVSRYLPGNYLSDNMHRVEFANTGNQAASLEGYVLVTRDYSVRLPAEAKIPPRGKLVMGKKPGQGINISLSTTPDFLIRFPMLEHVGNYLVLFDPKGKIVDAFYFSPVPNVPFLPDRDTLFTYSREKIPFYIPPENRPVWQYVTSTGEPSKEFVKLNGVWKHLDTKEKPATEFDQVTLRFKEGILSLRWATRFEDAGFAFVVEKSEDKEKFQAVDTIVSKGNSRDLQQYAYYEEGLSRGELYYYRIKHVDQAGKEIYSGIREVRAEEGLEEFSMEILPDLSTQAGLVRLRFNSQYSQQVRIKLYDARLAEVAILFDDFVYAGSPALIKIGQQLPPGNYLLLAETETRRFGKEFEVKE